MSSSEEERERLKEEYKEHYRRIKEAKERLKRTEQKGKIAQALNNMNTDELLGSVDEFLGKVRERVNLTEARLDVAMDGLEDEELSSTGSKIKQQEREEATQKQKAKQTLQQVKAEMGMLYSEIEKHADEIQAQKTIGTKKENEDSEEPTTE
ncbi:MAG: hypothetical protein MI700_11605 [Balneolales bacterium]|nr:hypothetical protein [Balneolales bacterium]